MKSCLCLLVLIIATAAYAGRSGSCVMGSGSNAVKVMIAIENPAVQVSYEGDDEITQCGLKANNQYDYFINCEGDEDEDDMIIRIKGANGAMLDNKNTVIARLTQCQIR